jgi:phenylacetate-CoA ligase
MNLGSSFTRHVYWPMVQRVKGEYAVRALQELLESQWKSQEELLADQWRLVQRTVAKAAREIPYYREKYQGVNGELRNGKISYKEFLQLPKVEKKDVRDRVQEFLNPSYQGRVTSGRTSGSTGESLTLYYTTEHESYSEAARWRGKAWWDIHPGSPQLTLWGRPFTGLRDNWLQKIKNSCMNTSLYSGYDIQDAMMQKIWDRLTCIKPEIIYGVPTAMYALARFIRKEGFTADHMGIKVLMTTAESCPDDQRTFMEAVFGCKTANEYGCSETGGFVYECAEGSWHISTELTFIEFLNAEGLPVSPGETGEIFLTDLRNDYMPLIRYRVGDLGTALNGLCACGRQLPRMGVTVCKENDMIRLANGENYMSGELNYISLAVTKAFPAAILQFRVRQKSLNLFDLEFVPGPEFVDQAEVRFCHLMKKCFGNHIQIRMKRVPHIERETTGKLRYFVSEIQ